VGSELHAEEILKLEFEYARETAYQAQNDRTVIVNLYLILVGGVGSLLLAASSLGTGPLAIPSRSLSLLFAVLGVLGVLTLFKLIRLRQAWYESVRAMNTIKAYYQHLFPDLDAAFLWKTKSIPSPGKAWTITFILSAMVILLSSISVAIAMHFTELRSGDTEVLLDAIIFAAAFVAQILFYFFQLRTPEGQKQKNDEPN